MTLYLKTGVIALFMSESSKNPGNTTKFNKKGSVQAQLP